MNMRKAIQSVFAALMLLGAGAALAQVDGRVVTTEGRTVDGSIRWSVRDKAYVIKRENVEILLEPDKIDRLVIPKPNELIAAEDMVRKGQAAQAIPILQKVITTYLKLNWDESATRLLAEAYLADGKSKEAIDVCEKIIAGTPEAAYKGDMAPAYWRALLMGDRVAKLDDMLTKAVKEGDRTTSAFALIARGDLIRKTGDNAENAAKALRDGYLRVVTLYKGVKAAQPEALYKAAQCFEKLGQSSRADSMRTELKRDFGSSEWASR
jgi:tetratricopeptide (TPR) repeat protein